MISIKEVEIDGEDREALGEIVVVQARTTSGRSFAQTIIRTDPVDANDSTSHLTLLYHRKILISSYKYYY